MLFLLTGWCVWILTLTSSGLKLELALLDRFLPGKLEIHQVEGSLLGGFQLQQVSYRYPDWNIQAEFEDLTLYWQHTHPRLLGSWKIKIADIRCFSDKVSGGIQGSGSVAGSLLNPSLTGTLLGSNLYIAGQAVGNPGAAITLSLPQYTQIRGSLHLSTQLESLPPLTNTWVKNPAGLLIADLSLKGFLISPSFTGHAHLSNGSLQIPATGIRPDHIDLDAHLHSDGKISFKGNFLAGSGTGRLDGTIIDEKISLQVQGDHLKVAKLTHWKIVISPDVTLQITPEQLEASGHITIPEALITQAELNGTVTLPEDVVFVSAQSTESLPFLTRLQLDIQLGDKIQIATVNLTTRLTGQLRIHQLAGGPVTGSGELMVAKGGDNVFKAYGQTLSIRSGRIFFTGGVITNPGLAITAVKTIQMVNLSGGSSSFTNSTGLQSVYTGRQTLTVGAHVTGSLNDPTVSLFSDPAMNQADMLSYLIFGYPRSGISGQQTGVLLTALSALSPDSMPSSTKLTEKLQKKLGINELNLESTQFFNPATSSTVSTTALVVGKQLSNKLSLHYSIGLFYPVSILNLRYQINKNWAVQSENSTIDNGADLLFRIERD